VLFHVAKKQYLFSVISLSMAFLVIVGIVISHESISSITGMVLMISIVNFFITSLLHFVQRNGEFVLRNIIDLLDVFLPLPKEERKIGVLHVLILNWRDTNHVFAGGAEVYIHELAKRWVEAGHQVTVFCGNDSKSKRNDVIDGVRIIRRGGFYFVYFWAFIYYILKFRGQFDVVIDCQNGIPFFAPLYVKEKVICVVHHIHQEVFRTHLFPPLAVFAQVLENRLMPFVYRNVQFVTVSESTKKEMEALSMEGTGITTIHNGIDPILFRPGKKSKHPLVLYVGRLKQYKSLPVLLRAFQQVNEQVPTARCVIAGDGEEKKSTY
jgi:glycosyltransferase involved in cell wall biosynthesis